MTAHRPKKSARQKLRNFFWPRMGWRRLARYYRHRVARLPGTPHSIAAGFAVGIAVSFTPFIGFHMLTGLIGCWMLRASVMAMVIGTVVGGNPWTLPFIWIGTYELGHFLLGQEAGAHLTRETAFSFSMLLDKPLELLLPMTMGCLPPAILFGLASFYAVRRIVGRYKKRASGGYPL